MGTMTGQSDLYKAVTDMIHAVGIPANLTGHDYVREAVMLTVQDKEIAKHLTNGLYPATAAKFNTTSSKVERAIRHAVDVAFRRGDIDVINGLFGYTASAHKGKPTNGAFIKTIADRITGDMEI